MFAAGDRSFNTSCANRLRAAGVSIYLPQDSDVNELASSPTAAGIFVSDTSALLNSDTLIAVLDQETIDAGVACEVGIGYAAGLTIHGLYTDIRQHRTGVGRMYKNLYVLGAIERSGGLLFDSVDALVGFLGTGARPLPPAPFLPTVAAPDASSFDDFIERLESWYLPSWRRASSLEAVFASSPARSVLDYGCGTGRAYEDLRRVAPDLEYVGFDTSPAMIESARAQRPDVAWSSDLEEALRLKPGGYDLILLHFVLHDQPDPLALCRSLVSALRPGGRLHIIDLSTDDLPNTTAMLRTMLATPLRCHDGRLGAGFARALAAATSSAIRIANEEVFDVAFPSASSLDEYLSVFRVYCGADLPLGLTSERPEQTRLGVLQHFQSLEFPWRDMRAFRVVLAERQ
jgi:SAM-dependent methyltransferase